MGIHLSCCLLSFPFSLQVESESKYHSSPSSRLLCPGMISGVDHGVTKNLSSCRPCDKPITENAAYKSVMNGKNVLLMDPRIEREGWARTVELDMRAKLRQFERGKYLNNIFSLKSRRRADFSHERINLASRCCFQPHQGSNS